MFEVDGAVGCWSSVLWVAGWCRSSTDLDHHFGAWYPVCFGVSITEAVHGCVHTEPDPRSHFTIVGKRHCTINCSRNGLLTDRQDGWICCFGNFFNESRWCGIEALNRNNAWFRGESKSYSYQQLVAYKTRLCSARRLQWIISEPKGSLDRIHAVRTCEMGA